MWEKKSDDDSIHDKDNLYTWDEAFDVHVATLNTICAKNENVTCSVNADCVAAGVGGKCGFAGKRDWRLPNIREIQSIVNYEVPIPGPMVSATFNNSCDSGDTVTDGSCTAASLYWSSTTLAGPPGGAGAGFVAFDFSSVGSADKNFSTHVRAVRGGSL